MKRKHREAMRAHADRQWDWYIDPELDAALEAQEWQERRMTSWTPSPQETAAMNEYLAAHPELPF
jgi:hypothetical protein